MIRIIGDIHGDMNFYLAARGEKSIQVGDYGIGFIDDDLLPEYDPNHTWIRGNHDNPSKARSRPDWIPDGLVKDDWMFVGGAWSIDWAWRTPGRNWWEDEELSTREFIQIINTYENVRPRIMVTHDAPTSVTDQMFIKAGLGIGGANAKQIKTRTGEALQTMFELHQPEFHFFGHWHVTKTEKINGTTFVCIGEREVIEFDEKK